MSQVPGQQLNHYRLVEKIGEGGMGVVWKAEDIRLGRTVALKLLPQEFAEDLERLSRFQREARFLASLNHPNIASIYGLEEADGVRFLVLEYVEGITLAEQLEDGPIPIRPALEIFIQLAGALEAAHARGVIHRDLKPANIKIAPKGQLKVLDFGLAKALTPVRAASGISTSPTATMMLTQEHALLGTIPYMSPEQTSGEAVDKRTDIWAFGCMLYEVLTGSRVFRENTAARTIAAIHKDEPGWKQLPAGTPNRVRGLLRHCLAKDPEARWRDIADARIEIIDALADVDNGEHVPLKRKGWATGLPWVVLTILGVGIAVATIWTSRTSKKYSVGVTRFVIPLEAGQQLWSVAISQDGKELVYGATSDGDYLYRRPLDKFEAVRIPNTGGAGIPFLSPDAAWLAYPKGSELLKVSLRSGMMERIASWEQSGGLGGSWGQDDTIVFGAWEIPAAGGSPKPITEQQLGDATRLRYPDILPGGRGVLYTDFRGARASQIVLLGNDGELRTLIRGASFARYLPTGHVIFATENSLMAAPFDLERGVVTGEVVTVVSGVSMDVNASALYDISRTGTLVYGSGNSITGSDALVLADHSGQMRPLPLPESFHYVSPQISPDGKWVSVVRAEETVELWLYDLEGGAIQRLAAEDEDFAVPGSQSSSIWTPDGEGIIYSSRVHEEDGYNLYWIRSDGSDVPKRLTEGQGDKHPQSWSPDGQILVFAEHAAATGWDLWMLHVDTERPPEPVLQSSANEYYASVSPDGQWLAYTSDETGRHEIYVRPFVAPGRVTLISSAGGVEPVWSPDGASLYFRDLTGREVFETKVGMAPGKPSLLFEEDFHNPIPPIRQWDLSRDGGKFIFVTINSDLPTQINFVGNWFEELEDKLDKLQ